MKDLKPQFSKTRYWECIFYPENCLPNWKALLPDFVQVPFCYCVHDKDELSELYRTDSTSSAAADFDSNKRKTHVHLILAFDGPTTARNVKIIVNRLSLAGSLCCPVCVPIISMVKCYRYLIHDTDAAREAHKFQYSPSERVSGNNFDIGLYNIISTAEKAQALHYLSQVICLKKFSNFADFYEYVLEHDNDEGLYFQTVSSYSGFFERIIKGIYLRFQAESERKLKNCGGA